MTPKVHFSKTGKPFPFARGICAARMAASITSDESKVTCKMCLKRLDKARKYWAAEGEQA